MKADYLHCEHVVEMATDWMEGALAPAERVELEVHLVTCAGCVAYIEQMRRSTRILRPPRSART
jgi:anti-sigma factor RsiW